MPPPWKNPQTCGVFFRCYKFDRDPTTKDWQLYFPDIVDPWDKPYWQTLIIGTSWLNTKTLDVFMLGNIEKDKEDNNHAVWTKILKLKKTNKENS